MEEFLKEALAPCGQRQTVGLLRSDSGFFEERLPSSFEQSRLPDMVATKFVP